MCKNSPDLCPSLSYAGDFSCISLSGLRKRTTLHFVLPYTHPCHDRVSLCAFFSISQHHSHSRSSGAPPTFDCDLDHTFNKPQCTSVCVKNSRMFACVSFSSISAWDLACWQHVAGNLLLFATHVAEPGKIPTCFCA